ncbi:acid-sensing ion channel 1C-like [Clytia hemisphaerica]|uniref:Uncharacterized protein n=1 Tax=Clytia hemisphaerica TaxID=252671 RepID=A0A7M5UYR4_9CNID
MSIYESIVEARQGGGHQATTTIKPKMADTMMLNFSNRYNNTNGSTSGQTPSKCNGNGECHRNKFSKYESQDTIPQGSYNDITYEIPSPTRVSRRKKIKEHTEEFIGNSTLHGFHYCFDKRYRFRRIIWILVVMGSIGMLLQKLFEAGQKYFDRPFTSTSTVINPEKMKFPAVSLCNINDFRMSKLEGTTFLKIMKGELHYSILSGPDYANASKQANHRLQNMLMDCTVNFMQQNKSIAKCSPANFSTFYQSQGEKCFTINSGNVNSHFADLSEGGRKKSLEMILDLEHYDYFDKNDVGVRLIIHDQDETPIRFSGVALPPGFTSYVEVGKTETINLKKPYKTACDSRKLDYFSVYSENACWLEKLTKFVTKKCHCKDGFMPGTERVCSVSELFNCTWPNWEAFKSIPKEEVDCPVACKVTDFNTLISYAQFPSNRIADIYAEQKFKLKGTTMEKRKFVRDNLLRIVIYYEKMTYKRITQAPSYDTMILLGDIGGQLGLFLGTSILTYLEFFDFLAMIIYTKYFEIYKIK